MSLILENIALYRSEQLLFHPVSAEIGLGEIAALMGPSGIGKSSLLSYIGGFLYSGFKACGHVYLNGREIKKQLPQMRKIAILFQDPLLFPHMTVWQNLAFGIPSHYSKEETMDLISEALDMAQMSDMQHRFPDTLSGGQKSRIALMRALLAEPEAVLLDEPFSALDHSLRQQMRLFVLEHIQIKQIPALLVTHDPEDASVCKQKMYLEVPAETSR